MAESKQPQGIRETWEALAQFGERYRAEAAVRARVASGDLSDLDLEIPEGMEFRVMEQSADTYYFPLPPAPNPALSDKMLEAVAGGLTGNCITAHDVLVAGSIVLCTPPPNARSCSG